MPTRHALVVLDKARHQQTPGALFGQLGPLQSSNPGRFKWRVLDGLPNFIGDVIFIFGPEAEHELLVGDLGHPAVALDARWSEERLQQAIQRLPVT